VSRWPRERPFARGKCLNFALGVHGTKAAHGVGMLKSFAALFAFVPVVAAAVFSPATAGASEVHVNPAREPHRAAAPAALFGKPRTWKITGHVAAYMTAMNDADASALSGHYVLSNTSLVTPWDRCDAPQSVYRDASVEEWFGSFDDRGLDAEDRAVLGVAPGGTVRVHDLRCAGGHQVEIVETAPDAIILVHDGIAFSARLVPSRATRAHGL
jgi:hypothetical protein